MSAWLLSLAAALAVFGLFMLGLGVGLLSGRRPIRGSCGGLNRIPGMGSACDGCRKACGHGHD